MTVIAERHKPRNISVTAVFDKDRVDILEELARGMGITRSLALNHLVDLHAGVLLEEIAKAPAQVFETEPWRARKLSREVVSLVAGAVREGSTTPDAYRSLQIPPKTGEQWERRGRADREKGKASVYADLCASLDRARAEFNRELVQEARRKGDYKTLLKLLDPEQFSEVKRSQVDVTHRFQLVIDWDRLELAETRTLAALLRKASPLEGDPGVNRTNRPALEAIPADVAEQLEAADEGEWVEAPALPPGAPVDD